MESKHACYDAIPNEAIVLATDKAVLRWDDDDHDSSVDVRLLFLPTPRLEIGVTLMDEPVDPSQIKGLKLKGRGIDVPGFVARSNVSVSGAGVRTELAWRPLSEPIIGLGNDSTQIQTIIIHVFISETCEG
ncbi:MAG: hypothetical protein V1748_10870 [Actinomycetota bacterium]